jgi:hypothetical protein
MAKRRNYEELDDIELSEQDAMHAEAAIECAERDLAPPREPEPAEPDRGAAPR